MLPFISKNSPKLWVATAQPISHSSVRPGGVIVAANAIAFSDHNLALSTNVVLDAGGGPDVGGGSCCASEMARLFTVDVSNY